MPKQIKLGLDKTAAPITKQYKQLIGIEGEPLFDAAGNKLVTLENSALGVFNNTESALPIFVNNEDDRANQTVPVIEQFPELSAVSNSLLGVPRAEEQLSLFSDVASYGLDELNWNVDTFVERGRVPTEWYNKKHPIHGRRMVSPRVIEGSYEQALYLKDFPSQYDWPGSTITERRSSPTAQFQEYINFILMGKYLYQEFSKYGETRQFAKQYFIDENVYFLNNESVRDKRFDIERFGVTLQDAGITFLAAESETAIDIAFKDSNNLHDVGYCDPNGDGDLTTTLQKAFDQIEAWTYFFGLIVGGEAIFPTLGPNRKIGEITITDFHLSGLYTKVQSFCTGSCRPGGRTDNERYVKLESVDTFRYQPGRVSGFTFGSRMKADISSTSNSVEWGCSNDTDEYMFQLRGSEFNIVRRSVIPMGTSSLLSQGLDPASEKTVLQRGVQDESKTVFETIIPREKFTGDALLGSGESGYVLTFEDVTMYKIEFSWYGAIGAKFYAYVPIANGEARWVLIHRLVIENSMNKPVLQNPDFKFKYVIYSSQSSGYTEPTYLYKYGSSYYIDGGDEGTVKLTSVTSQSKSFTTQYTNTNKTGTPIIGLKPKGNIVSTDMSYVGDGVANFKKIYPLTVSATANQNAIVNVLSVNGGPDGAHHCYQPCLKAESWLTPPNRRNVPLQFNAEGNTLTLSGTELTQFEKRDIGAKVVANGIYNVYVSGDIEGSNESDVYRRDRRTGEFTYATLVAGLQGRDGSVFRFQKNLGEVITVKASTIATSAQITARLRNYEAIIPSSIPIRSSKFKIHFLNPRAKDHQFKKDGNGIPLHFADFGVGVTSYKPVLEGGNLKYEIEGVNTALTPVDLMNLFPVAEYCPRIAAIDALTSSEDREQDLSYGQQLSVDPRIPNPGGSNSGFVSCVQGEIEILKHGAIKSMIVREGKYKGFYKMVLNSTATFDGDTKIYPTAEPKGIQVPTNLLDFDSWGSEFGDAQGNSWSIELRFKFFILSGVETDDSSGTQTGIPGAKFFYWGSREIRPANESPFYSFPAGNYHDKPQNETVTINTASGTTQINYIGFENQVTTHTLPLTGYGGKVVDFTTKALTLKDDFKTEAYNEEGENVYAYRKFKRTKTLAIGTENEYYPFFLLGDNSEINNISIEEIYPEYSATHTPALNAFAQRDEMKFEVDTGLGSVQGVSVQFPDGVSETNSPASFNDENQLSPSLFDLSTTNPLRPGTSIYTFYLTANEPTQIDLSNIFNTDRFKVSKGLYNNKAIYFTIKGLSSSGVGEMTVTVKEQ
jgi:hypothetical protein